MRFRERTCLTAVDLKASTTYEADKISLADIWAVLFVLTVDNTGGGSNGTAALQFDILDSQGNVLGTVTGLTAIDTKADTTEYLFWDRAIAVAKVGTGTLGSDVNALKAASFIVPKLVVTQASDATTDVATLVMIGR